MSKRSTRSNTSNTSASASDSSSSASNSTDSLPPSSTSLVGPSTPTASLPSRVFGSSNSISSSTSSDSKRGSVVSEASNSSSSGARGTSSARSSDEIHSRAPVRDLNHATTRPGRTMEQKMARAAEKAQKANEKFLKANNKSAFPLSNIAESEDLDRTPRATLNTHSTLSSPTLNDPSFDSPTKSSHSASSRSSPVNSFESMSSAFSKSSSVHKEKRFKKIEMEDGFDVFKNLKEMLGGHALAELAISVAVSEDLVLGWKSCPISGCSHKFPASSSKPVVRRLEHFKKAHSWLCVNLQESA